MKFMHLSDLHLGKRVHEYSMIEDQEYILKQIIGIAADEKVDAVFIAGDIYDKTFPPVEAVTLLDQFLWALAEKEISVWIISGNHDSAERLSFGSRLMEKNKIHIAPVYNGELHTVTMEDKYGPIDISLLPFVKPAQVKRFFPEEEIHTYTDALRTALQGDAPRNRRRILITHQFVTGATRCESEEPVVGGLDNVDASVFNGFDYVALGHIHSPQNVGRETLRYCGTPLKYSFSEVHQGKSVTIVTMKEKGCISLKTIPLRPLRDLKEIKGTYNDLTLKSFYEHTEYPESYLHITLTDEEDVPDAVSRLQVIYPHIMKLDYDNARTRNRPGTDTAGETENKTPMELFEEFYQHRNFQPMSEEQKKFASELMEKVMEEEA
ncbi:MAG: exonuclease SbcCD subunit D [Clostridia bacterium]